MDRGMYALPAAVFLGLLAATGASDAAEFDALIDRMALVSDEALNEAGPPGFMAHRDCDIGADEAGEFDLLLSLSNSEQRGSKRLHGKWGLPVPTADIAGDELLTNREYVVNYNGDLRIPVFATYVLQDDDVVKADQGKCFREDPRLDSSVRSVLADYDEDTYDRGHLVPRADMNRSRPVMFNTYVLSNIMPQHDLFNRNTWKDLEALVRVWACDYGSVAIVTGPVFDANDDGLRDDPATVDRVPPLNNVAVPSHFYKIVVHERDSGFVDAIAILLPHMDAVPESVKREQDKRRKKQKKLEYFQGHIVSIDEIESLTGYDFFPDMSATKQRAVERGVAAGLWRDANGKSESFVGRESACPRR